MILGVDHVALSCARVEDGVRALEGLGFTTRFVQRDVLNHPLKTPFLAEYAPLHSIAYCQGKTGVAIELTQHSARLVGRGSYEVLLAAASPEFAAVDASSEIWRAVLGAEAQAVRWPAFATEVWVEAGGPGVRAALVRVADLEAAARVWRDGLQFKEIASGQGWRQLAFRTPVANWALQVVLLEGPPQPAMLDAAGFPCVALLTSNIDRDADRLVAAGASAPSGVFALEVDGKPLKVALFRGNGGEPIELIEAARR